MTDNNIVTKKVRKVPSDYLYVNKKNTKVKMKGVPKLLGLSGFVVQAGIPFGYMAYRYDLFTFQEMRYAITGWGVVFATAMLLTFRTQIKKAIVEAEGSLGTTYQRSKLGNTMVILTIVVLLTNYFVEAFAILFMVVAVSTYSSLLIYKPYDKVATLQKDMQAELKRRNVTDELNNIKKV